MNRARDMLAVYLLPAVAAVFRLIITLLMFFLASDGFTLKYFQIIPLFVIAASCFRQYRLYHDGVPVISLLTPTIIQCILSAAFFKTVPLLQLVFIVLSDLCFLVTKAYKPTQVPFAIEGAEEEPDFNDIVGD